VTVAAAPVLERDIAPGGVPVRIRIASSGLAERLGEALPAPAAGPAATPVATLEAVAGVTMPPAPWAPDDVLPGEEVRGFTEGARIAAVAPMHGTVSLYDRERGDGFFWTRSAAAMPDWECGSPLRHLLRWALADHGFALLHGAAVGVPGGEGVLLLGAGGSGKSTTALACLEAGLDVVADDYCLLDEDRTAHRLYPIGKLGPRSLALLPGLGALAGPLRGPQGKAHVALGPRYAPAVRLRALVLPRVASRTGTPERVRGADVYRRLLASTMLQMPGRRSATLAALGGLIRALPAYELPVGPDLDAVVGRVAERCGA
jgi:hypothetical protein